MRSIINNIVTSTTGLQFLGEPGRRLLLQKINRYQTMKFNFIGRLQCHKLSDSQIPTTTILIIAPSNAVIKMTVAFCEPADAH